MIQSCHNHIFDTFHNHARFYDKKALAVEVSSVTQGEDDNQLPLSRSPDLYEIQGLPKPKV